MEASDTSGVSDRAPFREGFLDGDLRDLASLVLVGSRCLDCKVALFGERRRCENCSSARVKRQTFASSGTVYSYTIQRHPPPPPNACEGSWTPRPLAWIDLDRRGPRILAPVDCHPSEIIIGSRVSLRGRIGWIDSSNAEIVSFHFVLCERAS
jgi:uncharacterized protein